MNSIQLDNHIRPMNPADIDRAVELTRAEGWPHTAADWAFHLALGKGWVIESADGEILGTLLWWEFGPTLATLGLIVVDRRHQGRGLGRRLMEFAREELGGRTLRLVSTEAGYTLYRHFGFEPVVPVEQRQARLSGVAPLPPGPGEAVRAAKPADFELICRLDRVAFGADRQSLLHALLNAGECLVLEQSGRFTGFAILRKSGRGYVAGPVVALDQSEAKVLLSHLLAGRDMFCRIDVPRKAGALAAWLDDIGLPVVDRVTAMQNSRVTMTHNLEFQTYALTSQALG